MLIGDLGLQINMYCKEFVHAGFSMCTIEKSSNSTMSWKALNQEGKIAVVASSVIVFTMASFIIGFLCGRFCRRERKRDGKLPQTQTPRSDVYDDVVLQQHEQNLELKENVAYSRIQSYYDLVYVCQYAIVHCLHDDVRTYTMSCKSTGIARIRLRLSILVIKSFVEFG